MMLFQLSAVDPRRRFDPLLHLIPRDNQPDEFDCHAHTHQRKGQQEQSQTAHPDSLRMLHEHNSRSLTSVF
jgi:hypothetical protein